MRFRQRITFQAPTEVRSPTGAVTQEWANVPALTDLAASRATSANDELRTDRTTPQEELLTFVVAGDRLSITPAMALVDGEAVYDVVRVEPTMLRKTTLVTVRRIAL